MDPKGNGVYSVNIPRQLKKLGLTKDKYVRITYREGYVSGSCVDGTVYVCQVLNTKEIKDILTFKEPKHKLSCFCFRHPLLITVCDDWKLRVLNIETGAKQKWKIYEQGEAEVAFDARASPESPRRSSGALVKAPSGVGSQLLRRRTVLGGSGGASPREGQNIRAAQFILFTGQVLAVVSPDRLFIMKYDPEGRTTNPIRMSIALKGFSGVNKKYSALDTLRNKVLIGGPSLFQVWDIQEGRLLFEGELPRGIAQTFFHIKMKNDTVVGITSSDIYVWSICGRKNVDTGTNLITVPTTQPVSHLYVDDHYLITGHIDGVVVLWVRQTLKMLRMFNKKQRDATPHSEEEKKSDMELAAFLGRTQSSRHLAVASTVFDRRINKITRWGDWIFVASSDCNFSVWDRRDEGDPDNTDRPTRLWKLKEEVDNMYLDTERGRILLTLKQPHKIRRDKSNEEAQRLFFRTLKPKLEGFGIDPVKTQAYNMLEGSLQHKLTLCRDTILQVLRVLTTNNKLEEIAVEFGPNIEVVHMHLKELLASMATASPDSLAANVLPLDTMYLRLLLFQEKLNSFDKGSMKRFLASISLRSALEHLCSSIHRDFQQFLSGCRNLDTQAGEVPKPTLWQDRRQVDEDLPDDDSSDSSSFIIAPRPKDPTRGTSRDSLASLDQPDFELKDNYAALTKPGDLEGVEPTAEELTDDVEGWDQRTLRRRLPTSPGRQSLTTPSAGLGKPAPTTGAEKEDDMNLKSMRAADDHSPGSYLWKIHFGDNVFMVDRSTFVKTLRKRLGLEVSEHQEKLIAHVIDNSDTGTVSKHKFGEWLKGFGPIEKAVENTSAVLCEPWFHGFITHKETEQLLENEEIGTFLVRFSESRPGAFTLAFVYKNPDKGRQLLQIHVQNNPEDDEGNRFKVMQAGRGFKYFSSVAQVINSYSSFLKIPFSSPFLSQPWFFCDLTREESEDLLLSSEQKRPGLFLVRFSQRTAFASSYIDTDGEVKHSSIIKGSSGYKAGTNSKSFPTLNDLVKDYESTLQFPLPNTRVKLYQLRELVPLTG